MVMDEVAERPADAAPLTPAEKRDARRAAKALKKLEAEDKAAAARPRSSSRPRPTSS